MESTIEEINYFHSYMHNDEKSEGSAETPTYLEFEVFSALSESEEG